MKKLLSFLSIFVLTALTLSVNAEAKTFSEASELNPYKITAIGDSITYSSTYAAIIDSRSDCVVENLGSCGTQVAGTAEHSFVNRTKKLKTDADLILILGGTNDYRGFADLQNDIGDLNSKDIKNFCGAYNTMIRNLKKRNPRSQIVLVTPIKRCYGQNPNRYGYSLAHYAEATRLIAANNGIPCIDLYNDNNCDFTENDLLIDGLHPNQDGHQIIADEIMNYIILAGL